MACGLNPIATPDDDFRDECQGVFRGHASAVRELQPDVIVAMVTFRDMEDRQWSAGEGMLTPTDQRFRRHLLDGYELYTTLMLNEGVARVVWVIPPTPGLPPVGDSAAILAPERIDAYRRVVKALALSFPDDVVVLDMATWYAEHPDPPARRDGVHWTLDGAVQVADEFLVPALFDAIE